MNDRSKLTFDDRSLMPLPRSIRAVAGEVCPMAVDYLKTRRPGRDCGHASGWRMKSMCLAAFRASGPWHSGPKRATSGHFVDGRNSAVVV